MWRVGHVIAMYGSITFLRAASMVLPQMPRRWPLNVRMAQSTNATLITLDLPERTEPSQTRAS